MTAKYSALAREYRLKLDEILELTPRQMADVYFPSDEPKTSSPAIDTTARLQQILALVEGGIVKASPEQLAELRRRAADGHN